MGNQNKEAQVYGVQLRSSTVKQFTSRELLEAVRAEAETFGSPVAEWRIPLSELAVVFDSSFNIGRRLTICQYVVEAATDTDATGATGESDAEAVVLPASDQKVVWRAFGVLLKKARSLRAAQSSKRHRGALSPEEKRQERANQSNAQRYENAARDFLSAQLDYVVTREQEKAEDAYLKWFHDEALERGMKLSGGYAEWGSRLYKMFCDWQAEYDSKGQSHKDKKPQYQRRPGKKPQ